MVYYLNLCPSPINTSWAAFAIATQGKIAYTSTHKKGVLIHCLLVNYNRG